MTSPSTSDGPPVGSHPDADRPTDRRPDAGVIGLTWPVRLHRRLTAIPLRVRLAGVMAVLLVIALLGTGIATLSVLRGFLTDRLDDQLRTSADSVIENVVVILNGGNATLPTEYVVQINLPDGSWKQVGYAGDPRPPPKLPYLTTAEAKAKGSKGFTVAAADGPTKWRAIAVPTRDDAVSVVIAQPLDHVDDTVGQLALIELVLGTVAVIVVLVVGLVVVRRALRPLTKIEAVAAQIAEGQLSRRVPDLPRQTEVGSLAHSLNSMLTQIEQAFAARAASDERMRRFVADASHELRSPLATVRGYAELYRQGAVTEQEAVAGAMARIEDEATRMGVLVEDLLLLARLDERRTVERAPVDLTVVANDAALDGRAIAPNRRVTLAGLHGGIQPTFTTGDEPALRQIVANLVSNAVRHTPEGTPIEIAVGPDRHDGRQWSVIEVRDHGPGIDPQLADRVFERFFRADPARGRGADNGAGLGLSIVSAITQEHGGQVWIARTEGGGATFVVRLPWMPAPDEPPDAYDAAGLDSEQGEHL